MRTSALKVGVLIPRSGPAGIWAASCETSALIAAAEINANGGVGGRPIELFIRDAGSTGSVAAEAATCAVDLDSVDALVAMVPSSARQPIRRAVQRRIPFIYTPQFEGAEHHPDIITIGETAVELLEPAIDWLVTEKNASRFFLLGNDYLWPQQSMARARSLVAEKGASVVGNLEIPFGVEDHDFVLDRIKQANPHVVVSWLLGHEAIGFNREFASSGLAERILRFSTSVDETILYGIGDENTENLYVSSAYFSNLASRNNDVFLEKYHQLFGITPAPPNAFGESLYEGIHCLCGLVDSAESLVSSDLKQKMGRSVQKRSARGFDATFATGGRHPIHIAAVDGYDFRIIATR